MITKLRLEELIDKGATVYYKTHYGDLCLKNEEKDTSDYWFKRVVEIKNDCLHYHYEDSDFYEDRDFFCNLQDLYETKEDAEFASRYKRIPRTEWLDLPTWEEIWKDKMQEFQFNFIVNGFSFYCSIYGFTKTFLISCSHGKYKNSYKLEKCFTLDTKENYLKACEICRKLFLGEEIE